MDKMDPLVISLSGAQGGGKTTLLNELKTRGYKVDDFRVSRAVQKQLGWESLDRVMESPQVMMQFQDEVFKQKLENDSNLTGDIVLVERSFADIAAYTTTWMWKFVCDKKAIPLDEATQWLNEFTSKCGEAQAKCYDAILLLPMMSNVVFESDPHRAKAEDIGIVYSNIRSFVEHRQFIRLPTHTITSQSVADRANEVEHFIKGKAA